MQSNPFSFFDGMNLPGMHQSLFGVALPIILGIAFLCFVIVTIALLYHWLSFGKGNMSLPIIIPMYFIGSLIFLGTAFGVLFLL